MHLISVLLHCVVMFYLVIALIISHFYVNLAYRE